MIKTLDKMDLKKLAHDMRALRNAYIDYVFWGEGYACDYLTYQWDSVQYVFEIEDTLLGNCAKEWFEEPDAAEWFESREWREIEWEDVMENSDSIKKPSNTRKLAIPEQIQRPDGAHIIRSECTVSPYAKAFGQDRVVFADVDDESRLYTYDGQKLTRYDGEIYTV